jgi:DnaJ domain
VLEQIQGQRSPPEPLFVWRSVLHDYRLVAARRSLRGRDYSLRSRTRRGGTLPSSEMNDHEDIPQRTADPYETLQVSPRADAEVIEAAYRVLARRYHPDLNGSPDATAMMAQINGAWETLRDPARRATYDRGRRVAVVKSQPSTTTTHQTSAGDQDDPAVPLLLVDPASVTLGPLRRGARRAVAVGVYTEPPGIRVQAAVSAGGAWLEVSPAILQGLDQSRVSLEARTASLRPGLHRGSVEFTTSWATRVLPVTVEVRSARSLFRAAAFARHGPSGSGWRRSTVTAIFAVVLLLVIVAGLAVLALGR